MSFSFLSVLSVFISYVSFFFFFFSFFEVFWLSKQSSFFFLRHCLLFFSSASFKLFLMRVRDMRVKCDVICDSVSCVFTYPKRKRGKKEKKGRITLSLSSI
jgi:hypothetical protein